MFFSINLFFKFIFYNFAAAYTYIDTWYFYIQQSRNNNSFIDDRA